MIFKCPGSQNFNQPHPEYIKCLFCHAEIEIWSDEVKAVCPGCGKETVRGQLPSCLDWCKYAMECLGKEAYEKYLKNKKEREANMISKKMSDALAEQINKEIYSAYFYLGMSAYAASKGFQGAAGWFYAQWKEELEHAGKMFDHVHKKGGRVELKAIDRPPQDFSSAADLFEKTLNHEKKVTALINDLVGVAKSENDKETEEFLQWFVKEQKEEESTPAGILKKLKDAGTDPARLSEIDKELSARK